jgi:hypothetical protein
MTAGTTEPAKENTQLPNMLHLKILLSLSADGLVSTIYVMIRLGND